MSSYRRSNSSLYYILIMADNWKGSMGYDFRRIERMGNTPTGITILEDHPSIELHIKRDLA